MTNIDLIYTYMKNLKSFKLFEGLNAKIDEIIKVINPSDPMSSDEYYYYIWGDDEAYYDDNLKTSDYIKAIEDTVFKDTSNAAKKFGYKFIMDNKDEIISRCKDDLDGNKVDKKMKAKSRKNKNRIKNNKNKLH